jgi:putative polymerase
MPLVPTGKLARQTNAGLLRAPKRVEANSPQTLIVVIGVLTMAYNGILAALLAGGLPINSSAPAIVETMFLLAACALSLKNGFERSSVFPLFLSYFIAMTAIVLSIQGESIYIVSIRNFLIVSLFTVLGGKCNFSTLKRIVIYCSFVTLIVLLLEIVSLDTYVSLFQPAKYLSATRGMAESEYAGGLSAGTILFEGRFSLGLYSGPRTSSIFLEQVSINCFGIVLALYLLTFLPDLSRREISLHAVTVFAILATNNARMALIASLIFAAGYRVFPIIPKYFNTVLIPVIIGGMFIVFSFVPPTGGDDIIGRMATSYKLLTSMNTTDLLLGNFRETSRSLDSGYAFLIFSSTIFGLILYWLYISFVVPQADARSKRCAWGLTIYIGIWLLVGGTGTFSMKTAPLLWLIVGFVRRHSLNLMEEARVEGATRAFQYAPVTKPAGFQSRPVAVSGQRSAPTLM